MTTGTSRESAASAMSAAREQFLAVAEKEHATTMRVLRAFPADKSDLKPHAMCKSARELAWVFVAERGLGRMVVIDDVFAKGGPSGKGPAAPEKYEDVVNAVELSHRDFIEQVRALPAGDLDGKVKFFTGPKTLGDVSRMNFLWFLLHDEIHHRGQFSIYLRMAGGKVPSIYGPTADEPWF